MAAKYRVTSARAVAALTRLGFTPLGEGHPRRIYHPFLRFFDPLQGPPPRTVAQRTTTVLEAPPGMTCRASHRLVYATIQAVNS